MAARVQDLLQKISLSLYPIYSSVYGARLSLHLARHSWRVPGHALYGFSLDALDSGRRSSPAVRCCGVSGHAPG